MLRLQDRTHSILEDCNYSFGGIIDCTMNNVISAVLCACAVNVAGVTPYAWQ